MSDGSRRVTHISEVTGTNGNIISCRIFSCSTNGDWAPTERYWAVFVPPASFPNSQKNFKDAGLPPGLNLLEMSQDV